MRSVVSFLLGLLTLAAVAVAVPGLWFERTIVDESGYVGLVGPLGEQPEFRSVLADTVATGVVEGAGLQGVARRTAEPVVQRVAGEMTELSGFDAAWTETNRLSHRLNVTDIPPASLDDRLGIDLTPMVALIADTANERLGASVLPEPKDLVVPFGTAEQRRYVDRARAVAPWAWAVLAVGAALAVACIGTARRRGTALIGLGVGALVVAGLQLYTVTAGGDAALDAAANDTGFGRALMAQLHDAVVASYGAWLLVLAAVGVLTIAVGALVRVRT